MTSIRDEVIDMIKRASKPREPDLRDETRPLLDSGLDSLDYATVIMELEEKYNLKIDEKDIESLGSLKDIVIFIEGHVDKSS